MKKFNSGLKMEELEIQKVSLDEIEQLEEIGRLTFTETFAAENREENMRAYLEGFSTDKLRSQLTNKNSEFYFAVIDGKIMGYLKINFGQAQTEIKDDNSHEIERIYVLKEFHGKKVGQELYKKAIEIAKRRDLDYVWLGVWEKNPRAIRFYEKNGFREFDRHIFKLGNDPQTDIMMKLPIR